MVNEHVYIIRVNDDIFDQKILFLIMSLPFFREQVKDLAFRKKGQPGLNLDHIKRIKIPYLPTEKRREILVELGPAMAAIDRLNESKKNIYEVINEVFSEKIGVDIQNYMEYDHQIFDRVSLSHILTKNDTFRLSFRWNKAKHIQELLCYESKYPIEPLRKYIKSIKNGWSPTCGDLATKYKVFSLDAINYSGKIDLSASKYSDEEKSNLSNYIIREGDFLISRGNTVDLVALASVVENVDDETDTIYPDLMIRIEFDDRINKKYMAFLFNSFVGRMYFKYASKGKNQTMVKVSRAEINDFLVPVPDIKEQERIVDQIEKLISEQMDKEKQESITRCRLTQYIEGELFGGMTSN